MLTHACSNPSCTPPPLAGPSAAFSHLEQQQFLQADHSSSATISPAPPPLTDSQRSRASKALTRALELQQQRKLSLSPQLQLLVLQPLSQYQQYAQGVGAYAHVRVGSCQTRQLDQEVHEQDMQTEEVRRAVTGLVTKQRYQWMVVHLSQ